MMKYGAKAVTKYARVSPKKARLAADMIRGKSVIEAEAILRFSGLKGSEFLYKTLKSAAANAEMQMDLAKEEMRIVEVRVDEGPRLKRAWSKNKGGRHPILRKMSHFTVIVDKE